jgi:hypothetical protein
LAEVKDPGIVAALERLLTDEVAGDPMGEQRWVHPHDERQHWNYTLRPRQQGK